MGFKLSGKAKEVIAVVAPTLGAALGGPLGGLAGQIIGGIVGGNDPKALEEALLTQKPETLLALRKAEQEFKLRLKELEIEEDKLVFGDRSNARELAKLDMTPHKTISALFIGGYFLIFVAIASGTIVPDESQLENVRTLLTMLGTSIPMILAFWFGSNSGSKEKTALLFQSKPADSN
jgi:hypothetical protein